MDVRRARELYRRDPYWPVKYQRKIRRKLGEIIEQALQHGEEGIRIAIDLMEGKLTIKQAREKLRELG